MMFEFLADIEAKDVAPVVAGIIGGGIVSLYVARKFIHRPTLKFALRPAAILRRSDFGRTFEMRANGKALNNLCVFSLDMTLVGRSDISKEQVPEDNKPTLFFPNFSIYDVRTIEYDESRFNVPLSVAGKGCLLIFNIDRIRAHTHAQFQVIGSFWNDEIDPEEFLADFYPGSIHNVDVQTSGHIRRPWKKHKDERRV